MLLKSRWTRLSEISVRKWVLSNAAAVVLLLQVVRLLLVMAVQRQPLLRWLLPKNVQRLTLKLPNRNVRLPKKSKELQSKPRTASKLRKRGPMMRARRPMTTRKRLRQTRMLPMLRRSKRLLMPS